MRSQKSTIEKDSPTQWKEYCESYKINHIVMLSSCPSYGVHEIPQPVSQNVHDKCNDDYSCDGCQAYRDHLH